MTVYCVRYTLPGLEEHYITLNGFGRMLLWFLRWARRATVFIFSRWNFPLKKYGGGYERQ